MPQFPPRCAPGIPAGHGRVGHHRSDLATLAAGTGAVDASGDPLVVNGYDAIAASAIEQALRGLTSGIRFDVSTVVQDDASDLAGTVGALDVAARHDGVPQLFQATVAVRGDGFTVLDERSVFFLVPPTPPTIEPKLPKGRGAPHRGPKPRGSRPRGAELGALGGAAEPPSLDFRCHLLFYPGHIDKNFTRVILVPMNNDTKLYVAFAGDELITRDTLASVVLRLKALSERGEGRRLAVFDDDTGRVCDVDVSGTDDEVRARYAPAVGDAAAPRGRGRPRLGVVSREVSLLPRHWQWLGEQRCGASATLRRLVDAARKNESQEAVERRAIDAAHRFLWDLAGDLPGFEEATRALFAKEFQRLTQLTRAWPPGIREQLARYVERANAASDAFAT